MHQQQHKPVSYMLTKELQFLLVHAQNQPKVKIFVQVEGSARSLQQFWELAHWSLCKRRRL